MTSIIRRPLTLTLVTLMLVPGLALAAGGSSSSSASLPDLPEMSAQDHYLRGLKARDKAWELEEKAASLSGAAAEKVLKKMRKQFENAAAAQRMAIKLEPRAHQAHSSLGYALRRLGNYEKSIAAYNKSLEIAPAYAEAIEYRGEAYLQLGQLEDAKDAYMQLFRSDTAKANQLLEAMGDWIEENRGSAASQEVEDFATWVTGRGDLAAQISMAPTGEKWKGSSR